MYIVVTSGFLLAQITIVMMFGDHVDSLAIPLHIAFSFLYAIIANGVYSLLSRRAVVSASTDGKVCNDDDEPSAVGETLELSRPNSVVSIVEYLNAREHEMLTFGSLALDPFTSDGPVNFWHVRPHDDAANEPLTPAQETSLMILCVKLMYIAGDVEPDENGIRMIALDDTVRFSGGRTATPLRVYYTLADDEQTALVLSVEPLQSETVRISQDSLMELMRDQIVSTIAQRTKR